MTTDCIVLSDYDKIMARLVDGQWHSAYELSMATGIQKRSIRDVAQRSDGEIISGNSGYKLTCHATDSEIYEFVGRMTSQINLMRERTKNTLNKIKYQYNMELALEV
jgi:hypothetical protein